MESLQEARRAWEGRAARAEARVASLKDTVRNESNVLGFRV
jgi:hypothetical protein